MEKQRIKIDQHGGVGLLWCAGWFFTIGYLKLSFWWGVLAIILWPYLIGADMAAAPDTVMPAPAAS